MRVRFLLMSLIILLSHFSTPAQAADSAIRICGDRDPLSMTVDLKSESAKNKQANLSGFSVDMMRAVFLSLGRRVEFIGNLPWKRCMSEVESGNIDFAMDAYFDLDRAKIFAYSTHYNTLTPQIFFLKSNPPDFSKLAALKRFRGCGVLGTSYAHYGLRGTDLDLGDDRDSLFRKLLAKRCDYFVEELEDIASFKIVGIDYLANSAVQHETVTWAVAPSKFLITVKNGKNAAMLDQIDSAIYSVIRSGQADKFWKKTSIDLPYKP